MNLPEHPDRLEEDSLRICLRNWLSNQVPPARARDRVLRKAVAQNMDRYKVKLVFRAIQCWISKILDGGDLTGLNSEFPQWIASPAVFQYLNFERAALRVIS